MRKKNWILGMMTACILGAVLTACSGSQSAESKSAESKTAAGGTDDKEVSITLGDTWAETHPMARAMDEVFKKQVEEKSGGKITVNISHNGLLGNEADLWSGVRSGTIDMAVVGTVMNQEYTKMLIADWPFLYRDLNHAKSVWTGEIGNEVAAEFHEKFPTTYLLGWGPNSARTFSSSKKLETVEDFNGLKLRMPNNPIHIGIAENLGASSQTIPLGDLYSALETGVVDGQDNGMVTILSQKFEEVQKWVYETNHIIATLQIVISADCLDGLSENQQNIIKEASKEASAWAWDEYIKSVDEDRETLKAAGVTVTPLTPENQAKIIEKIKPVYDKLYSENDWAEDLVKKIQAVK
ncbi:TRAP transporter substrate-binding protein [Lacrimispora sp.]|jgi:tripartite ATP-independent transporter DctP family solute receptor|uniref:TRAP transporter substrate-binding protein n=1 Tax=Lacrimispora sp. TaxID=2719234 RepID=UPI00289D9495|nr:TRAP transporter substrate-binding protein [Lacrimispora sp.]